MSVRERFCERFFGGDPYAGFDDRGLGDDLQGWGSCSHVFKEAIEKLAPRVIIEVGSWKGLSAIHMAGLLRERGIDGVIFCVDTWLGSGEHWINPEWRKSLRLRNGYPGLYYQFLHNVIQAGFQDIIVPVPLPSQSACHLLADEGISAPMIYVDASHLPDAVHQDIQAWWPLLEPGGLMIGDDDSADWPGVVAAANWFVANNQLQIHAEDSKWYVRKPAEGEPPPAPITLPDLPGGALSFLCRRSCRPG